MALKIFRPLTPSLRFTQLNGFEEITKGNAPVSKLTERLKKTGGRNSYGRLTSRHIGGGHKQRYRFIDFKRNKLAVPAKVEAIEYDPIRTARIALLKYNDGELRYIIAPVGLEVGATVLQRPRRRAERRQCAAAGESSAWRDDSQYRNDPRTRRADRSYRGQQFDAHVGRRRLCAGPPALR